jgi:hypothetical protein
MARYEFRFIVTDPELSKGHQQKVGQAVAEAGALALVDIIWSSERTVTEWHLGCISSQVTAA